MLPEEATVGGVRLERAQGALVAAVAATCSVSIFAAQVLFAAGRRRLPGASPARAARACRACRWTARPSRSACGRCCPPRSRRRRSSPRRAPRSWCCSLLLYLAVDSLSDRARPRADHGRGAAGRAGAGRRLAAAVLLPRLRHHQPAAARLPRPLHDGVGTADGDRRAGRRPPGLLRGRARSALPRATSIAWRAWAPGSWCWRCCGAADLCGGGGGARVRGALLAIAAAAPVPRARRLAGPLHQRRRWPRSRCPSRPGRSSSRARATPGSARSPGSP